MKVTRTKIKSGAISIMARAFCNRSARFSEDFSDRPSAVTNRPLASR